MLTMIKKHRSMLLIVAWFFGMTFAGLGYLNQALLHDSYRADMGYLFGVPLVAIAAIYEIWRMFRK
jgi:hypothetical protein